MLDLANVREAGHEAGVCHKNLHTYRQSTADIGLHQQPLRFFGISWKVSSSDFQRLAQGVLAVLCVKHRPFCHQARARYLDQRLNTPCLCSGPFVRKKKPRPCAFKLEGITSFLDLPCIHATCCDAHLQGFSSQSSCAATLLAASFLLSGRMADYIACENRKHQNVVLAGDLCEHAHHGAQGGDWQSKLHT